MDSIPFATEEGSVPYALMIGQTKVALHAEHLHRGAEAHIVRSLREKVEGKYTQGSFIRRNSASLLKRSPLTYVQGDPRGTYVTTVEYVADRVAVHPGDRILCRLDSLNKLGALGRAGDYLEVKVYLPRDQYGNAPFFERPEMGVGATVWIETMPSPQGFMNENYVTLFGKILSLRGDALTREPEGLPAALRRVAPQAVEVKSAPTLGEKAPSLTVVTLAHNAPAWDTVFQALLKRSGASPEAFAKGRRFSSPFADVDPLTDRRFWWELVQRTAALREDMPLSCTVLAGDQSEAFLAHVQMAAESLLGADSVRLPGEFHAIELAEPKRMALASAVFVVDEALRTEDRTLSRLVASEPALVQRLLAGLAGLEPSGTLAAVISARPTQMMVDWMAWLGTSFREVTWLRPEALDPQNDLVVVLFEGFSGVSEKTRKVLTTTAQEWADLVADGAFVGQLEPSPATPSWTTSWAEFLERVQRQQIRAARNALRILEDDLDTDEERALEQQMNEAAQKWARTFRYPLETM